MPVLEESQETWKDIPEWEGLYQASTHGNIRSVPRMVRNRLGFRPRDSVVLKPTDDRNGYPMVGLSHQNKPKRFAVHSLVAKTFNGPKPEGFDTCHNDGNKKNNRPDNLRYDTRSGNMLDKAKHGTTPVGEKAPRTKHTEEQIRAVKKLLETNTPTEVSRLTGLSIHVAENVKRGKAWRHLNISQGVP